MPERAMNHYETELVLREMMETAKARMIEANDRAVRLSLLPSAHDDPAVMKAAHEFQIRARKEYWCALKDFTDFVVEGIVPKYLAALNAPPKSARARGRAGGLSGWWFRPGRAWVC